MNKNIQLIRNNIKAIILGFIVLFGMSYALADWTTPKCLPPTCNIDYPVNATSFSQAKIGGLSLGKDTPPRLGYIFMAENGSSKFSDIVTRNFTYVDGSTSRAGKVLTSDANGLASWRTLEKNLTSDSFIVTPFSLNVPRNTYRDTSGSGLSLPIDSTYQFCALSQVGPDYGDSNNASSTCSVIQNSDKTWTLHGDRADDPDMICKAQCFKSSAISSVTRP
jgi:hypothetical protein